MKIFGWVLIVMFILYTILPLHYYTEQVFVEGPPKVIEYYTFEDGKMNVHKSELPNISVVERTQRTWFLLVIPLEILDSPASGIGRVIGYFSFLVLGIWLIKRKKRVVVG